MTESAYLKPMKRQSMNEAFFLMPVRRLAALASGMAALALAAPHGQAKVTYEDDVLPILRNNCLKCHNQNEQKGGLDLSNFNGAIKGGASGTSVSSGDPDSSKLFRSITHAEEPTMPPNAKLPDKEIDVVRQWIAGGLLESSGSKAIASNKPKVEMAIDVSALKPKEPLPMPQDLLLEPVVRTESTSVANGMAANPWSPLVAVGGQRQVLLYNTDTLDLIGVLPFPEGYPQVLRFSRSGKLLLAGGGEGARQGSVVVWDVATGERIIKVGEEFDTVLAADLSADQKWIVLGGTDRLVKFYSTEDGQLKHTLKKHTDWVTAIEISPDGKFTASGDRNGNIYVWETATAQELYTLKGHRNWITGFSWRMDSEHLASTSEDATAKLWKVKDEREVRNTTAHRDGALSADSTIDGRLVTCGRDSNVTIWDANGGRVRNIAITNDLPVRAVFTHDANRVIAGDWTGQLTVWNAADGKQVGTLSLNPPTLAQQYETAGSKLAVLMQERETRATELKAAEAEAAKLAALVASAHSAYEASKLNESGGKNEQAELKELQKQSEEAVKKVASAKAALDEVEKRVPLAEQRIKDIRAAQFNVKVYAAKDQLAAREIQHAKTEAALKTAESAVESAQADLKKIRRQQESMPDKIKGMENVIKFDRAAVSEPEARFARARKQLAKSQTAATKLAGTVARLQARAAGGNGDAVAIQKAETEYAALQAELQVLEREMIQCKSELEKALKEVESDQAALAKLREEEKALDQKSKAARDAVKKAESELASAKSAVEKSTKALAADKERVEQLRAEYRQMRGLSIEAAKSASL